ncbi:hypothetical protein NKI15_19920 [Mesorhizobium sp. M0862]|uniref:hypothetical protein n=1 Tax=Mesorhizobium sp. M0862 TaxID=2957015 RepID=UPI00333C2743
MTIAACYVSPEGVVLGADSTSTYGNANGPHYFNHAQKLFELGERGTLGMVTWGLGGLGFTSYRRLIALVADELAAKPPKSVSAVADLWIDRFWDAYISSPSHGPLITTAQALSVRPSFNPAGPQAPNARTKDEEEEFAVLRQGLFVGFCLGGYVLPDRTPTAFTIAFDPLAGKPKATQIISGYQFWGAPNMIQRLIFGCDDELRQAILSSGKWGGTTAELEAILAQQELAHPIVPIRDALDFIHACIASTIKALKFSTFSQICGGPIEIAVITADRPFRWVRHKEWDSAIMEGVS